MLDLRLVARILSAGALIFGVGTALGQGYPNKPIRIITTAAGGPVDLVSRLTAQGLTGPLGQQVIVDNRTAFQASEAVSKAPPDGYTLITAGGSLWIGPLLQKMSYDVVRDFAPISIVTRDVLILVVHPSLPVKSVKELTALAKARPGALNYASPTVGSPLHLAAALFNAMAGVNIVRVNYKGTASALNDVIAGQVQVMFPSATAVGQHLKSGRLRGLAVTSAEPSALAPGLPTMATEGLPGYECTQMYGIFAPAKTPVAVIDRLNQEVVRAINAGGLKEQFLNAGMETVGSSPGEFIAKIKSDISKWSKVINDAGIKMD